MANPEHLEILKQGVEVWNEWRKRDAPWRIDLKGASLPEALLSIHYDAITLDPDETIPIYAVGADLRGVNLEGANLRGARIESVNFREANLNGVDFTQAKIWETDFTGATLDRAMFSYANVSWDTFAQVDLSGCLGLDYAAQQGPSAISADTLYKSRGRIPAAFLRGCGLSDWQIENVKLYQPDLSNEEITNILYRVHDLRAQQAIQISPLFISYTHADGPFVDQLEVYLNRMGVRFWRDVHHSTAGRLERQIDRAIRLNPTVLLVLSRQSVRSDWVEHEARLARKLELETGRDVLCPIALDDSWKTCQWPERLREQIMEYNVLDFSKWWEPGYLQRMLTRLVEGLDLFYK